MSHQSHSSHLSHAAGKEKGKDTSMGCDIRNDADIDTDLIDRVLQASPLPDGCLLVLASPKGAPSFDGGGLRFHSLWRLAANFCPAEIVDRRVDDLPERRSAAEIEPGGVLWFRGLLEIDNELGIRFHDVVAL